MGRFDFALDPAETMTIRRIFAFDRVPNKGNTVYSVYFMLRQFLVENGWEYIGQHRRDQLSLYMRAPERAEAFSFDVAIPNDEAVLRVANEMIADVVEDQGHRAEGRSGWIGKYNVLFQPLGSRTFDHPSNVISEQERHRDHSPILYFRRSEIWGTELCWMEGYDNPPTWNRQEHFSALMPGLTFRGQLLSDCTAIHEAELKRYEEAASKEPE